MPTYKLSYFDTKVRAELARLALAAGGIQYEDVRVQFEDWPGLKPKMPQGTLPILEVDGKVISQSLAIARYIARVCVLMGKTPWEEAEVNCVLDTCAEFWTEIPKFIFEEDITRKKKIFKNIMEQKIPKVLGHGEQLLAANSAGKGFLVGSALTLADLALYDVMQYPLDLFGVTLEKYPKVAAHRQKVEGVPKVNEYLKKRPSEDKFVTRRLGPDVKKCQTSKYKLIYFPIRARAEVTRLVFAASGIDFEDCRIDRETEWPDFKSKTLLGKLPVLEVDGEQIAQSLTIARFVAREAGLMGKTSMEQAKIEMVVEAMGDVLDAVAAWFREEDENAKEEKKKKAVDEAIPTAVSMVENMLTKNTAGGGFLVGSSLSLADLALYDRLQLTIDMFEFSLDKYPKTAANRAKVAELPRIAEWLKKRPVSQY
ncbi:hypothetical protein ScPMuIL_007989 [Solemya velum]